jgi:hypothetical protein
MRLNSPNVTAATHRNVFVVCAGGAVVLSGAFFVYSNLIRELEESSCERPRSFEDAKVWLQALQVTFCVFLFGAIFCVFSLCKAGPGGAVFQKGPICARLDTQHFRLGS